MLCTKHKHAFSLIEVRKCARESKEDIESADELVVEDKEEEKEGAETEESKEDETSEDFKAQLEALQVENAKLKKSLHFMLAERVVDAKIALGLVEMASRATELTEHSTRTASSLADALRDLEKRPAQVSRQVAPVIEQRSLASDKDSDSTVTHGDVTESKERQAPLPQQFEDMMVDVMMNRKKL